MMKVVILFTILLSGCVDETVTNKTLKGLGSHLYWHEGIRYTIKSVSSSGEVKSIRLPYNIKDVSLYEDKNISSGVRYNCEYYYSSWDGNHGWCKLYINSLDSLLTADWNHGKFGSGSTERLTK